MISKGLRSNAKSAVQEPQALVVAPTRELVLQIYNDCHELSKDTGVRCVHLYGGTPPMRQVSELRKGAHVIVATHGRLMEFIRRQKVCPSVIVKD